MQLARDAPALALLGGKQAARQRPQVFLGAAQLARRGFDLGGETLALLRQQTGHFHLRGDVLQGDQQEHLGVGLEDAAADVEGFGRPPGTVKSNSKLAPPSGAARSSSNRRRSGSSRPQARAASSGRRRRSSCSEPSSRERAEGVVGGADAQLDVDDGQGKRHVLDHRAGEVASAPQLVLAAPELVDVQQDDDDPFDLVVGGAVGPDPQQVPVVVAILHLHLTRSQGVQHLREHRLEVVHHEIQANVAEGPADVAPGAGSSGAGWAA